MMAILARMKNLALRFWGRLIHVALWRIPHIDRWGFYLPAVFLVACWAWWELSTPLPGYCIAALAFGAVIMTVRADKFTHGERILWVCIGAALMVGEMRVLYRDRQNNDRQVSADRESQNARFVSTTSGLEAAIKGINTTIQTSTKTLVQTAPHAAIRFADFKFAEVNPGDTIRPGSYPFNTNIVNKGNDTAFVRKQYIGIYTGKPDDKEEQERLVRRFSAEWKAKKNFTSSKLLTDIPVINTTYHTLTQEDVNGIVASTKTIYFLARIEYADSTGVWDSEDCEALQNTPNQLDLVMRHSCFIFIESRRSIRPR